MTMTADRVQSLPRVSVCLDKSLIEPAQCGSVLNKFNDEISYSELRFVERPFRPRMNDRSLESHFRATGTILAMPAESIPNSPPFPLLQYANKIKHERF